MADFSTTPGDGVDGYAREAVVRPASWFTRAPRDWSHAEAATLTTAGLTAWRALVVDGGLKAGDTVLVLGTGGVSVFALQFAKAAGATVIATSSSDEKLERMRALGASHGINYKREQDWGMRVREITDGRGVDHVVEVGGPGTLPQSIAACRIGGHIALIGVLTGRGGEIPTALLMARQQRVQGLIVGSRAEQEDMVRAVEATGLRPVIDSTFPLAEIAAAFRHEEAGRHFGKICLETG
jgi:NADPH:quinone reductase-like Zn-dependent oxidoreductase